MKLKTVAMTGMMSLAGLGLIGVGAHAVYNDSTVSNQSINAGTLGVVLSNPLAVGNGTGTITLATPANVGSSFTTGDQQVQMYNNGSVTATEATISLSGATTIGADNSLLNGLQICIASNNGYTIFNGALTSAIADGNITYSGATTIAPTGSDYYYVNVYAGNEPTMCAGNGAGGSAYGYGSDGTSSSSPLVNGSQSESVAYSLTVNYTG
jgi:predicted ribosomally synthesized peptide with SipW-like signal peptide